jgi:hypothetical protein
MRQRNDKEYFFNATHLIGIIHSIQGNNKEAIKAFYDLSDTTLGIAETFEFEYGSIYEELKEHLEAIEEILDKAEPTKCIDL